MSFVAETIRLDITRALSRAGLGAPTGIDRVEMAWIDWALSDRWRDAQFVARTASGVHALDRRDMAEMQAALREEIAPPLDLRGAAALKKRRAVRRAESLLRRRAQPLRAADVYANVGHANLTPDFGAAMRAAGAARVVVKIHDVIPLEHPEFARADGPVRMKERLAAAAAADGVVFNSTDTARRALAHMESGAPTVVAPLGVDAPPVTPQAHDGFVCLGTIEPRKNHALLLDIWEASPDPPPLHIIGRRGWLNDALFARLDARPGGVFEHADLDDGAARSLLAGARALLFPSLAEGYGLPLAEGLALGVSVIASDLPALREVGGDAPRYLAPDDAAAWARAIASPPQRDDPALSRWVAPRWEDHFAKVDDLLRKI